MIKNMIKKVVKSERGAISIEYIAIGMVVLAIAGGILTYLTNGNAVGEKGGGKIIEMIENVGKK